MNLTILASSSERRIALLRDIGIDFVAINHKLQKEPLFSAFGGNISVALFVEKLSLKKAESLQDDYPKQLIIGSDTVIYLDGTVYGKPKDIGDAFDTIKALSGKTHEVYTGVSLINKLKNIYETTYDKTIVKIKSLSSSEIADYLGEYSPLGRAGSYGIQDKKGIVESYAGSFENVLGLPVQKLIPLMNNHFQLSRALSRH